MEFVAQLSLMRLKCCARLVQLRQPCSAIVQQKSTSFCVPGPVNARWTARPSRTYLLSHNFVSKSFLHYDLSHYSVPLLQVLGRRNSLHACNYCTGSNKTPTEKLSLLQRFKQMYRDYWYVLVPVHVITSIGWFGAFFYMLQSGVDVIAILENLNVSEKVINPLRDSKAGYLAISYALYKIATPLRYTITLGGTTVSINYLKKWGYIKPIPARDKLKEMYQERKDNLLEKKDTLMKETTEELKYRREQLKERTDNLMKTYRDKSKN